MIPKLRFKGFVGGWEEKKLGDIVDFKNGKAHERDISETGKYIVINSKFVSSEGRVKKYSNRQISPVYRNDIVMVMSDVPNGKAIAKCFFVKNDDQYTLNQRICSLTAKKNISNASYLVSVINRNKFYLRFDDGVSQTNLKRNDVLNLPVTLPSIDEQEKIAGFLTAVDEKISHLEVKKAQLEKYKKGVMRAIFSQKIRFKDGQENEFPRWEVKRLGEVFYSEKGNGLSKDDVVVGGINECILYGELYTAYNEVISNVRSKTNSNDGIKSQVGDLLIPCSTTTTGIDLANVTALNKEGVLLGGDITVLRSKDGVDNIFYAYYLSNYKRGDMAKYAQGSTIVHLYYSHFKKMNIDVPCYEEQEKIAEFLTSIDKLIESKQQQIAEVKQWKKGLVQGMFV